MKHFFTFVFALLLLSSSLFGWTKGSFFQPEFISNPYNDEEIVFTASSTISRLDINTGYTFFANLSMSSSGDIKDVIINGESKRIGYLLNGRIAIFNYMDFTEIANFTINYAGDSQDIKVSFSKDGNKVYTFKKSELRLSVYDIPSGTKSDEIIINANPTFYSAAFLNSNKAEFALMINDSLEIWSIHSRSIDRKIPFDSKAELVQFRNSGDNITYNVGKNIFIVSSQTGADIYNQTLPFDIFYYEFSANMQYMICREEYQEQSVWDIVSDTLIFEGSASFHSDMNINFIYINSSKTRTFGFIEDVIMCGPLGMPGMEKFYFLFDMPEYNRIISLGDGHLINPYYAIINLNNKLILVSSLKGDSKNPKYNHVLVDDNGKFLKFIHVNRYAIAFSHDSKYIAFYDTSGLMLYNIESGIVEKTLKIQRNTLGKIFFSPQNSGLIVSITKDYIDVYDYNTLTLKYSKEIPHEEGYVYKLVCDLTGKISIFYQSGRYLEFDTGTGDLAEIILNNLPEKRNFEDMTNDGRYILWSVNKDSIVVYDTKNQNIKFSYKHNLGTNHAEMVSIGFLGIHEIVWFAYIDNPIDKYDVLDAYDFVEERKYYLKGEGAPRISMDGRRYVTFGCPYFYSYNSIRLPVSVFEGTISENLLTIFPNPASEYITISKPSEGFEPSEGSGVKIYNTLGECVLTTPSAAHPPLQEGNLRLQISHLPRGIYYLRIGSRTQMFVKL